MAVECTINVGFHSNFGSFRQSGHSKTPLRLAIINEFRSTQPTTIRSFHRLLDPCMKLISLDIAPFVGISYCQYFRHFAANLGKPQYSL